MMMAEVTAMATTAAGQTIEGMKASAMTEGRYGHILDEDGYILPTKFDAAFGDGTWVMDEKLDGHRIQIRKDGDSVTTDLRSIPSLPDHIVASMRQIPDGIYDGELLVNIPGAVSTDVPNRLYRSKLIFAVFDAVELMGQSILHLTQVDRRALLEVAVKGDDAVMLVAQVAPTWANVKAIFERGGEGTI